MFGRRDYNKVSFIGVGLALIIFGILVFAVSGAIWLVKMFDVEVACAYPFLKMMGAAVIMGLGYLILEIELLRRK